MQNVAHREDWNMFWCPRCGTIKIQDAAEPDEAFMAPKLIGRMREFVATLGPAWTSLAHRLGILEAIASPGRQL
jgi:hypothetical protein